MYGGPRKKMMGGGMYGQKRKKMMKGGYASIYDMESAFKSKAGYNTMKIEGEK